MISMIVINTANKKILKRTINMKSVLGIVFVGVYLALHPFSYGSQLSNKSHNFFKFSELVSYSVFFIESHELTSIHSFPLFKHL